MGQADRRRNGSRRRRGDARRDAEQAALLHDSERVRLCESIKERAGDKEVAQVRLRRCCGVYGRPPHGRARPARWRPRREPRRQSFLRTFRAWPGHARA